jgi:hypothetical protein
MKSPEIPKQPERKREFEPWGQVTKPEKHTPAKYRYLVHAINPDARSSMMLLDALIIRDEPHAIDKSDGNQSVNLFSAPERLGERVALSCSLIDQQHYGTWGRAGLIVEAPQENVIITHQEDAGTDIMSKKLLLEQESRNHLLTAEELLLKTDPGSYNEVVILANNEGKKASLAGLFYKTTEDGTPMDEMLYSKMRQHALRLNLPLISIKEPNPYAENKITRTEDRLLVQYGGKLYTLRGTPNWKSKAYLQSRYNVFIPPEELEQVFDYLKENDVDEKNIERLRVEYTEVDKTRQQPVVKYDEQGNITSIVKRSGYGTQEIKTSLSKNDSFKINVIEEIRMFDESMANNPYSFGSYDINIPSVEEAKQVIHEAIKLAPKNEKPKIGSWWNIVQKNIRSKLKYNNQSKINTERLTSLIKALKKQEMDKKE